MIDINLPTEKARHVIEYEPEITTTRGTVKRSQLPTGKPMAVKEKRPATPRCPFLCRPCYRGCAFYNDDSCNILTDGKVKTNSVCPFSGINSKFCDDTCKMYSNGSCRLFSGKAGA